MSEKSKKLQEERRQEISETEIADLKSVMSTPAGRRFVWKMIADAAIFHVHFNPNFGAMSFDRGRASLGLQLYADVHQHCFAEYQAMEREARDAEIRLQLIDQSGDDKDDN